MLGNPWFAKEVLKHLTQNNTRDAEQISINDRMTAIQEHARLQVLHYGERGLIKLRKHLPWYFKNMSGWKDIRSALVRISTIQELDEVLATIPSN